MKNRFEGELCTKIKKQIEPIIATADGSAYNEEGIEEAILKTYELNHEVLKADFSFICEVCGYINKHGNKEDKKWIENLVWNKLIPVYKNQDVDKELVEHLIAQVTDCMTFKVDDK